MPSAYPVDTFVGMGFPREMVLKGIKEIGTITNGGRDANAYLELLLTYTALVRKEATKGNISYHFFCT